MKGILNDAVTAVAISIWIGALFGVIASLLIAVCYLPNPVAICWLSLMVGRQYLCDLLWMYNAAVATCDAAVGPSYLWCSVQLYGTQVALTLLPLGEKTPEWAARMTRFSLRHAIQYNNVDLRIEDEKALRPGRPYVVGG